MTSLPSPDSTTDATETARSDQTAALRRAVVAQLDLVASTPLESGLYLVATPIGNLSDITLRALHVLAHADLVYCEDTRQTRKLIDRYALRPKLRAYHDHSSQSDRDRIIEELASGKTVALVSDAGTPLISDPGHKLVREARAADITIRAIPGASAILTGLTVSGLEIDRFFFEGFLPNKSVARRDRLARLRDTPAALAFYESPNRLATSLADMAEIFGRRSAIVTRELTKRFEEHRAAKLPDLAAHYATTPVKGEIVVLVAPPDPAADVDDAAIRAAIAKLGETMSLRDASRELAEHFGIARKRVYEIGLAARNDDAPA